MKCASAPSAYRNCNLRASVWIGRNFSPARNVRSMTAPSAARRSLVRTNAPPLPGLTCWNSRILKTVPSTSMWLPFLNWFVEIIACLEPRLRAEFTTEGPDMPEAERQLIAAVERHREAFASAQELGRPESGQHVAVKSLGRAVALV